MAHPHMNLVRDDREQWLKQYYFLRAAFSVAWVAAAFAVASKSPAIAGALLVLYPAWDAAANLVDAMRSGGLARNRTQALNVLVSLVTTVAVLVAMSTQTPQSIVAGVTSIHRSSSCTKLC